MKENPRPYRHWTVKTVSDHDAYVCQFRLPSGELLTVGTLNLSAKAAKRRPVRLAGDVVRLARTVDVLLLQEAGSFGDELEHAVETLNRGRGYKRWILWQGDGRPGQASTPILYRADRADSHHTHAYPLTGRLPLEPAAAGPSTAKPKWLMVLTLLMDGELINVANLHATPSTRFRLNAIAALRQFRRAGRILLALPGWSFPGGDLNQVAHKLNRFLAPWRRRKLRSSQRALNPIDTGPHHSAIDDVWFETRA